MRKLSLLLVATTILGCATTYTTGSIDPETKELKFRSATTAAGSSAIENSKSIEFLAEDGQGFHVEASGTGNVNAKTELDMNVLLGSLAQITAILAQYMATP